MIYSIYAITNNFFLESLPPVNFRDEKVLKAFGLHLKKIRLKKRITQEELAYKANVSLSQIARIETGRINPTLCTLLVLAKAMEINAKEFLDF